MHLSAWQRYIYDKNASLEFRFSYFSRVSKPVWANSAGRARLVFRLVHGRLRTMNFSRKSIDTLKHSIKSPGYFQIVSPCLSLQGASLEFCSRRFTAVLRSFYKQSLFSGFSDPQFAQFNLSFEKEAIGFRHRV